MLTRGADNLKPYLKKGQVGKCVLPRPKKQSKTKNNNLGLGNFSIRSFSHLTLEQDDLAENSFMEQVANSKKGNEFIHVSNLILEKSVV